MTYKITQNRFAFFFHQLYLKQRLEDHKAKCKMSASCDDCKIKLDFAKNWDKTHR